MNALRTKSVQTLAARCLAQGSLVQGKILRSALVVQQQPSVFLAEPALRRFISSSQVLAYPAASAASGGVKEVKPSKDLDLKKYLVVDVREPSELAGGFIPGSVNVPLDTILSGTAKVPQEKPLLLVCRGGVRSLKAATALASRGYKDVTSLATGVSGCVIE